MPPGPPVFFLHMPKTAGTSLRRMLQASLGMDAVYPSDQDLARRSDGNYPTEAEVIETFDSLRPYFILTGHFSASLREQLPIHHRTAVFLRDPLQRSLSALAHFEKTTGIPPDRLLDDREFVDGRIRNRQTILLGGAGHVATTPDSTHVLEQALEHVDAFDFVGLTERFRDSCEVFDAVFGTTIHPTSLKENVSRPAGTEYDELIPRILPLVELDRMLYEHATSRFTRDTGRVHANASRVPRAL